VSDQKVSLSDLIGIPFKYGETDCWWLAREVYGRYGKEIPEYVVSRKTFAEQNDLNCMKEIIEDKSVEWIEHDAPIEPCLVVMQFGLPFYHHVGVYVGKGRFIHTSKIIGGVTIEKLGNLLYAKRKFYTFNSN